MAERPHASYAGDQPYFFVSYGHADADLVYPEMRWLQEAGFNLWYDEGIHVGSVWRKAIADALTGSSGMLFVATASSVGSDNCLKELNFVLDEGKPVFVVQLDDTKLPGLLRLSLSDRQMLNRADFPEANYRARLTQALATVAPPAERAPAATPGVAPSAPSAEVRNDNLPRRQSVLVGRGAELADIAALLKNADLVTVTGTGGVGKTRICIEVAAAQIGDHEDGVWLAELAPVSDPDQVPGAIARAMTIDLPAGQEPLVALVERLRLRRCVIILDNCEHVIDAVAALAEQVLDTCAGVKMLASSQELLGVEGEQVFRLRSLGEPDAVTLFTERAQSADAAFRMTPEGAVAAAAICRRLDGIPLAIEMAAARAPTLGCEGVLQRLDDRFRVLTGGRRTALPRQRTLVATLDWSHGLLSERDAAVFRRLGIFTGGFSLDAAAEVAADERTDSFEAIDGVASLVAKSLVVADPGDAGTRYRLLETTRAYALEKLDTAGETSSTQRRHAEYFLKFVTPARGDYYGPVTDDGLADRYFADMDNVDRAIDWAFGPSGDAELGIAITVASAALWSVQSLQREYLRWLEVAVPALTEETPTRVRAQLLVARASMLMMTNQAKALAIVDEAIEAARASGEPQTLGEVLNAKGFSLTVAGRLDEAVAVAEESGALAVSMPASRLTAQSHDLVAMVAWLTRGGEVARPLFEQVVTECRSIGAAGLANWFFLNSSLAVLDPANPDPVIAMLRDVLASIRPREMLSGLSTGTAAMLLMRSLTARNAPGDVEEALRFARTYQKASGGGQAFIYFTVAARIAAMAGRPRDAARLQGRSDEIRAVMGNVFPVSITDSNANWALVGAQLTEDEVASLRAEGARMSLEEAYRLAVGET